MKLCLTPRIFITSMPSILFSSTPVSYITIIPSNTKYSVLKVGIYRSVLPKAA